MEHVLTMLQNINAKMYNTGINANSNIFQNPPQPRQPHPTPSHPPMAFKVCRHHAPISLHHPNDSSNQQVGYCFSPTVVTSVLRLLPNKILTHCIAAGITNNLAPLREIVPLTASTTMRGAIISPHLNHPHL